MSYFFFLLKTIYNFGKVGNLSSGSAEEARLGVNYSLVAGFTGLYIIYCFCGGQFNCILKTYLNNVVHVLVRLSLVSCLSFTNATLIL